MTVVPQYGICNNQVCRTAEALDKRLYDLSLLRRAEVTGIKGVKLDMKLFPFSMIFSFPRSGQGKKTPDTGCAWKVRRSEGDRPESPL